MESTGKVTPHKVAPSEPTIDTTLITIAIAGNNENRNTANACVATTNKIAVKFNGIRVPSFVSLPRDYPLAGSLG